MPTRHRRLGDTTELLFYWLDAYEEAARPGTLHLFGKVRVVHLRFSHNVDFLICSVDVSMHCSSAPLSQVMTNAPDVLRALRHNDEVRRQVAGPGVAPLPQPAATYASSCVSVSGLERCMFVLPRSFTATGERVEFMDVYREIAEIMRSHMGQGATFKAKKVTRSYAFELADVPRVPAEYLKLCSI